MAIDKSGFQAIALKIPVSGDQVDSIVIELAAENVEIEGALYVTDIMLQGGTVATSHVGHVSEIRWSFENA